MQAAAYDMHLSSHRALIDQMIEKDDPFLVTIPFQDVQEQSTLDWISSLSRRRAERGRITLVENGWTDLSAHPDFSGIADLDTGEAFEHVGGVPGTAWGTTSDHIKDALQKIYQHSGTSGNALQPGATMNIEVWSPEFSSAILEAVEAELERCDWHAYPGVVQEEIRSELGPLDALDEGTEAP